MNRDVRPPSPKKSRAARAIIAASVAFAVVGVVAVGEGAPAVADPSYVVSAIPTSYRGASNSSGGVGDVRASWRNDGTTIEQVDVTASAPPAQYFQRAGTATVYLLAAGSNLWTIDSQPNIASACSVDATGTNISCQSLPVSWPAGGSLAISFPTYVAPNTAITGALSVEPGTTMQLSVASTTVTSNEATAIGTVDTVVVATVFPTSGSSTFSGTANPGTMVSVDDASGSSLGTSLADNSGAWQVVLAPGYGIVHPVFETVDGIRSTGSSGYYNSYSFSVAPPSTGVVWGESRTLTGSAQPHSIIVVRDDAGRLLATSTADTVGAWSVALPLGLTPGAQRLSVADTISDGSTFTLSVEGTVVAAPPLPASRLDLSVSGVPVAADGESVRGVEVRVTDALGRPIAGRRVDFAAPFGFVLSASSCVTDVHGVASTTVTASRELAAQVSARIDGASARTTPVIFTQWQTRGLDG